MSRVRKVGRNVVAGLLALVFIALGAGRAAAAESLCDASYQDCRAPLLNLINNETVGLDVAFWFMEDSRYATAIINRWKAGVPVRVLIDQRALPSMGGTHPAEVTILQNIVSAGIPVRQRSLSNPYIMHWKTMVFAGQNTVEFSGANYSPTAFVPQTPYADYEDEAIYFSDDPSIVSSFKTKYDDLWTDYTNYADYANITNPPVRVYPTSTKDPQLNFPQQESYANRLLGRYSKETQALDVIMFRITDERETNAVIQTMQRGIPVRVYSDTDEYRVPSRQWVSYNMDKLWAAGVPLKVRAHAGLNHQKLVLFYSQGMSVFGSSNWTSPSDKGQQEHNMFSTKAWQFNWFVDMFNRKWNNTAPTGDVESTWFQPLPPDKPVGLSPADGSTGNLLSMELQWDGGYYGQIYDVYFGTDPNPPLYAANLQLGPKDYDTGATQKIALPLLQHGTTYYWRIVGKTMAGLTAKSPIYSFATNGTAPPPAAAPSGASTVVIWSATDVSPSSIYGSWQFTTDSTAAGGKALWNPDHSTAKISPPLPTPTSYFETTFNAMAGVPYHLWVRIKAQNNSTLNNSVSVQFNDSLDQYGSALYRIGTAQGAEVVLQNPSGTLSGWGWDDNGFGAPATPIYFATTGIHTLRVQQRSDGAMVDQIVLSPDAFITTPPGPTTSDTTIYGSTIDGAAPPAPSSPPPPQTPPLPSGWQQQDIGAVGLPGYAEIDQTNTFSAVGAGADIWGSADALHYAYTALNGDGSIVARVTGVANTQPWVKGGVMIRETTAPGAANAFMLLSYSKGTAYQRRLSTGATTSSSGGGSSLVAPYWVRLDRAGNVFTAYQSADGVTWKKVGSDTIAMATSVLVGLAVSSHTVDAASLVTFDSVTLNGVAVGAPCTYSLSPGTLSMNAGAGSGTVSMTAGSSCSWSATSNAPWITIGSGASGSGNGSITVNVAANTGASRSGTVTIADQTLTVEQSAASCSYSLSPASQAIATGGGSASIAVTTSSWCSWTATSTDPSWLTVASGGSGTGNGTVIVSASANTAGARTAGVTIGDQTFTATQAAAACSYTITPTSQAFASGTGTASVSVTTGSWCSWSASSNDPTWLTIGSGASGIGNGSVTLSAAANSGPARSTTATIAGLTLTASQAAAPCTFSLTPASQSLAAGGDTASVAVSTGSWCSWTATSSDSSWLTVTGGASGTGNGTVTVSATANSAGPRSATVAIGNQVFTANQAAASCSYAISPASQSIAAGGATATVTVTTSSWCSWTASSSAPAWLAVTSGASGTGTGTVSLTAAANSGGPRSATATIAGQTFTASQAPAACSYAITPTSQSFVAGGSTSSISVTTGSWCSWTASSSDPSWLTIASGATGTGNGAVSVSAAVNNGATRTATVSVGDQTFTATQSGTSLPAGWAHQDVGATPVAGDTTFDGATYTVTGSGADVWGTADAMHFAYESLTGDGSIVARVTSVQNTNSWAKAGVMIRETLDPGAANAFMLVSYSKGLSFQQRTATAGATTNVAGAVAAAPYWVRLDRTGSTITAYQSPDGVVWTLVGSSTVSMAPTVFVGLAVTSHTTDTASAATFDNVAMTTGTPVSPTPWMHRDVGAVGAAGSATFNTTTSTYTVKGGGADIWGTADAFHYLYRPLTGDGAIVARVASIQNINSWTKAGVMIRETLDPGSAQATMLVSYSKGTAFQRRTATGGTSTSTTGPLAAAPYWVKVERVGTTINAYASPDGTTWTLVGSDTIPMANTVYIGLAISSHTTAAAASATFDNVTAP